MVNWHFFKEFPPITHEDWVKEFYNYQQYPEFTLKNSDITLTDFKRIWFMEWAHRMSGRTTGLLFVMPALFFAYKGWIRRIPALQIRLWACFGLLTFQGLLGWYMVKSGLTRATDKEYFKDIARVSQYRLAAHLGTAFILYSLMLWASLSLLMPKPSVQMQEDIKLKTPLRIIRRMAHSTKTLIFITAISGAFVAGLDAGLVYNTFPKMGGYWFPPDLALFKPTWKNLFENPTTVQFDHRLLATITLSCVGITWFLTKRLPSHLRNRRLKLATNCMLTAVGIQVILGIGTLIYQVPVWLASLHQSGSLVLLSNAVWLTHELRRIPKI